MEASNQEAQNSNTCLIKEGQAEIAFSKGEVFYNPVQEVNRDLSVAIIKLFIEQVKKEAQEDPKAPKREGGVTILEALSATGLRSIRYFKEIPGIKNILVNDLDPTAVEAIKQNIEHNKLDTKVVIPNQADATTLMYNHREKDKQFDVIDLDPYGSPAIFLDGAVQAVSEGGLLCVTCTDLTVLCGNYTEVCWSKYGAVSFNKKYCHEMALRIVLANIETHANRYKRYIVPLISLSIDFYLRVWVRVFTSPQEVKRSATKISHVYQCTGCDSFALQPVMRVVESKNGHEKFAPNTVKLDSHCSECGRVYKMGGPIWSKPTFDPSWVNRAAAHFEASDVSHYRQKKKIFGLLTVLKDELVDVPLFYSLPSLCNNLHVTTPSMKGFQSALKRLGYEVSISHTLADAIKSNAPSEVIWDLMRAWNKQKPAVKTPENSPAAQILAKEPKIEADFTPIKGLPEAKRIPKFVQNPANWGPGTRAKKRSNKPVDANNKKMKTEEEEENDETMQDAEEDQSSKEQAENQKADVDVNKN